MTSPAWARTPQPKAAGPPPNSQASYAPPRPRPASSPDQYVSTEHLLLALAAEDGRAGQARCAPSARAASGSLQALAVVRGTLDQVTDQNPGG